MADFGDPSTWEMNVDQFIDSGLPKEKPQELLDLQEQNRKQRLLQSLQKIGPRLEDSSLDFIKRENFFKAGEVGKPLISDSELKRLAKKFTQKEIAEKTGVSLAAVQRYFSRLGLKSVYKPGGYKGAISETRKELEKKLPQIRKLYLKNKLTIPAIADELGYTKKQIESVIEALRGQSGSITEPERIKLYEKNKITKEDFAKRGKLNPQKTPQNVIDDVIKDSKNFSFSETAKRNNISMTVLNRLRKENNLKFPYLSSAGANVNPKTTKDANKLLNVLKKNPELITNVEKLYEKVGLDKTKGGSAIQALKNNTTMSGNVPRFNLSKDEQKLVDKLSLPRISVEQEARKAGVKAQDIKSGMLRPRVALQEYFAVGDPKKRGTVFEHSFPRALIPFVKDKKLQQQLMITGERTSPFLNDFKIRYDNLQKGAVSQFLKDGNLSKYNKTINNIRDTVRKATGGYEIGYIKFDKNKNATPIVKAKSITEGVKQFGVETTQKVSAFKNAKYTTNLLKKYVKKPDDPIFNTLRNEVPVEKITPEVIEASEDAAKAYKKAEPFIGNKQKFINFAKNNLDNSVVNALFKSPYGRAAVITGAVLSPSYLAADEPKVETSDDFPIGKVAAGAAAAPLATKKGRSIYGKAGKGLLKMLSSPSAALGFGAYELGQGNTKLAGASLLAPEVLSTLAPAGKGILSRAGSILMNPFGKAARAFTPVGLATIGAGAAYDVYKEIERRQALTDEERLQEDIEAQAKDDEMMVGAAEGGRIGYSNGSDGTALAIEESLKAFERYLKAGGKLGYKDFIALGNEGVSKFFNSGGRVGFADGPDDPKRRTFMKVMAGIASLPILGKFFKPAVPLIKKLSNTTTKMPDWFPNFVDRFMNKGIGNKIDADLTEYTVKELPDVKLLKQDNGAIRVEGKNAYNEEYYIDYEPPGVEVVDYNTGKTVKTKGDFVATDTEYRMVSPEDYDIDGVNVDEIDDILGGSSTDLEGFAKGTGKTKYTTGQRRIDEADARGASKDESLRADINDPYEGVDGSDFTDD